MAMQNNGPNSLVKARFKFTVEKKKKATQQKKKKKKNATEQMPSDNSKLIFQMAILN